MSRSFLEQFQGQRIHHLPGQSFPMPNHSFSEEILPDYQPEFLLAEREDISSCPVVGGLGEETDPHLATPSFHGAVESTSPSLSLLFSRLKYLHVQYPGTMFNYLL